MTELKESIFIENESSLKNIFIPTNNNWQSTENNKLKVIESGKNGIIFNKVIKMIGSASKIICLQSFLIQDTLIIDALLKAKRERKVRVFIMDSAEARLGGKIEEDDSYITKDYINLLTEKFKYNFVHRQAGNFHAKFILVDPTTNAKGLIFTGNFTKKPFFENPELGVLLNVGQVKELYKVFVYHFWELATDEQLESDRFIKIKPVNKFKPPILSKTLITSPNNSISNLMRALKESILRAENEISFSTFGFDISHELSKLILEKLENGITVTVFCRPREKSIIDNISVLSDNGAKVYCHPLLHAKSLIVDDKEAFVFTANFEKHGMDDGFEVGCKLNRQQLLDLITVHKRWVETFPFIYESNVSNTKLNKYFQLGNKGILEEHIVTEIEDIIIEKDILSIGDIHDLLINSKLVRSNNVKSYNVIYKAMIKGIKGQYEEIENISENISIIKKRDNKKKGNNKNKIRNALLINKSMSLSDALKIIGASKLSNNTLIFGKENV